MSLKINAIYNNIKYLCHLKTKKNKFSIKRIDDKLIRGRATSNLRILYNLKKNGITQIIDLRNPSTELSEYVPQGIERIFCHLLNINYCNFKYSHKLEKMPDITFFEKINDKILNNNGKTLIHCRHGKRRTGVCVAIYEKYHTNKNKDDILNELYNTGFRELQDKSNKISKGVYSRLTKIYNDFIENFYPNEARIK